VEPEDVDSSLVPLEDRVLSASVLSRSAAFRSAASRLAAAARSSAALRAASLEVLVEVLSLVVALAVSAARRLSAGSWPEASCT
jgi:hypothetical protein